ncbi:coiled-coil domain-containing protein 108, partial [Clonorchis sinensis]
MPDGMSSIIIRNIITIIYGGKLSDNYWSAFFTICNGYHYHRQTEPGYIQGDVKQSIRKQPTDVSRYLEYRSNWNMRRPGAAHAVARKHRKREIQLGSSELGSLEQQTELIRLGFRDNYCVLYLHGVNPSSITIPVELDVYRPRLALENDGQLYFQPTHVKAKSLRRFGVINKSSVATSFKWHIPSEHRKQLCVEPTEGTIQPNEIQYHKWTFSPSEPGLHKFRPQLIYQDTGKEAKRKQLKVIALAQQVTLRIQPDRMVLEPLTIGASQSTEAILHNCTLASTYFALYAKTILNDVDAEELGEISISPQAGWLPGLCSRRIQFVVCPKRKASYRIQLSYELWIPENATPLQETYTDSVPRIVLTDQVTIGEILLEATFPTLEIVDVHGSGKLSTFSTSELWHDLDIDGLNRSLCEDPTALELEDSAKTRPMFRDHPAVNVDRGPVFDWCVGSSVATIQDETALDESTVATESQLHVLFENKRPIDVECVFLFPSVYVVDPPSWADDGTYTDDELHHRRVENDRLFDISPRKFRLHSGETMHVLVTYRHKLPGADHLPVLMKINGGREIKLRLFGITLPLAQPYFHFAQRRHILPPTLITEGNPKSGCLYRLPLRNPSTRPVQFLVAPLVFADGTKQFQPVTSEVTTQRTDSTTGPLEWGIPVFHCLTPEGIVEPGGFGYLEFNFRPLEAETYLVNCTISIRDAEVACNENEKEANNAFLDSLSLELEVKAHDPRSSDYPASSQNQSIHLFQIPRGCCARRLVHLNYRCEEDEDDLGKKTAGPKSYRFRLSTRYREDAQVLEQRHTYKQPTMLVFLDFQSAFDSVDRSVLLDTLAHQVKRFANATTGSFQFVQVTPHTGRIEPGQSIQLEIQFFANGDPRWITVEMTCELFDEAKEINYYKELKAWEEESERRKFEFVITDRKNATSKPKGGQGPGYTGRKCLQWSAVFLKETTHNVVENSSTAHDQFRPSSGSVPAPQYGKRLDEGQLRSEPKSQVQRTICTDLLCVLLNEILADTEFTQQLQIATWSPESDPTYRSDSLNRPDDPAPLYTQLVYSTESGKSIRPSGPTIETIENERNGPKEAHHRKSEYRKTSHFQLSTNEKLTIRNERTKATEIGKNEGLKQSIAVRSIIEQTVSEIVGNILAEANAHECDLTTDSLRVSMVVMLAKTDSPPSSKSEGCKLTGSGAVLRRSNECVQVTRHSLEANHFQHIIEESAPHYLGGERHLRIGRR